MSKKILYITHEDDHYGAARSFMALFSHVREYGFEPVVISVSQNNYSKLCEDYSIEFHCFDYKRCCTSAFNSTFKKKFMHINYFLKNKKAVSSIVKLIEEDKDSFCLIHINSSVIDIGMEISKKTDIPMVWHFREFLDLDFNQQFYRKNQVERINDSGAHLIFISNAIKKHWVNKGIKNDNKVIYNGVNPSNLHNDRQKKSNESGVTRIVLTGHITKEKGQWQLIKAASKFNKKIRQHIHIDFYGTGSNDYLNELRTEIEKSHLSQVISFKGYSNNIAALLPFYQIGVVCSKAEGFGRVTIEYMQAGLCVVASDTGANPEIIKDKENGLLYRYSDPDDLYEKLLYLIENQDTTRNLAYEGEKEALSKFSEDRYIRECVQYYGKILQESDN